MEPGIRCAALVAAFFLSVGMRMWIEPLIDLAFLCVLAVVAVQDIKTRRIADGCWIVVLLLAAASFGTAPGPSFLARIAGLFCVGGPMLLLCLLLPGAFGGGDIKLAAACGAFLGWRIALASAALAFFGGGAYSVWLLAVKKKGRKERFAFGPFLCLGMAVGALSGERLLVWLALILKTA